MSNRIVNELESPKITKELHAQKSKIKKLWGPLSIGLSPKFFQFSSKTDQKLSSKEQNKYDMIIEANNKQHSPRSPLKKCEEELIVTLLMTTIKNIVEKYHKDINTTAQETPFYLRKAPKGEYSHLLQS